MTKVFYSSIHALSLSMSRTHQPTCHSSTYRSSTYQGCPTNICQFNRLSINPTLRNPRPSHVSLEAYADFLDDFPEGVSFPYLNDIEKTMLDIQKDTLSCEQSQRVIAELSEAPFTTINIRQDLQACLDFSLENFQKNDSVQEIGNRHKHINQYRCESLPIAIYSGGSFRPIHFESKQGTLQANKLKPNETIIKGQDFIDTIAKYASQALQKNIISDMLVMYRVPPKQTTFSAHCDHKLELNSIYNPTRSSKGANPKQPTTAFLNQACLKIANLSNNKAFKGLINQNKKKATEILREHGTYAPTGTVCIFPGPKYSDGDGIGMPHSGPNPIDSLRCFYSFELREDLSGGYF